MWCFGHDCSQTDQSRWMGMISSSCHLSLLLLANWSARCGSHGLGDFCFLRIMCMFSIGALKL